MSEHQRDDSEPRPPKQEVTAKDGGTAAGRDVRNKNSNNRISTGGLVLAGLLAAGVISGGTAVVVTNNNDNSNSISTDGGEVENFDPGDISTIVGDWVELNGTTNEPRENGATLAVGDNGALRIQDGSDVCKGTVQAAGDDSYDISCAGQMVNVPHDAEADALVFPDSDATSGEVRYVRAD